MDNLNRVAPLEQTIAPMHGAASPPVVLYWRQFGPYHHDRCNALAEALGPTAVVGLEIAERSREYDWRPAGAGRKYSKETLFPGRDYEAAGMFARYRRLVTRCVALRARHVFLCHYEQADCFALAVTLRLLGRRVYTMFDSKFDDKPRSAWRELLKKFFLWPYSGAFVSSSRSRAYLQFLGYAPHWIAEGYDTVSVSRVRALAGAEPAPGGTSFSLRHFTVVARFLPKKNLGLAIDAYALYRARSGSNPRDLVICGAGPLGAELAERARGIDGIHFAGFLQEDGIAQTFAKSLSLILPSVEEQWGLVVNEALAMGVPVLAADNVGARDRLVRTAVDGYIFESDNAEGLARLMSRLASDEDEWRRLAEGALAMAAAGDVARFVEGVLDLTGLAAPAVSK